jgi:hypothetical protein
MPARIWVGLLVLLGGCSYNESKTGGSAVQNAPSFALIKEQILGPRCLACHSGSHPPTLVTYDQVKANAAKIDEIVVVKQTMPKRGPIPAAERELLATWIRAGAPEEGATIQTGTQAGPRPEMTWKTLKETVLNGRCFVCHFEGNTGGLSNLDDSEVFREKIGTIYFLSVADSLMPPPPAGTPEGVPTPNRLARAEKEAISFWVVDGMKP